MHKERWGGGGGGGGGERVFRPALPGYGVRPEVNKQDAVGIIHRNDYRRFVEFKFSLPSSSSSSSCL